jgi:hypothetical protein
LLRLPFGRPRFRDTGGDISSASAPFSLLFGTLSPPMAEPLREGMAGLGSERRDSRQREKWGCALGHGHAQHLKRSDEGDHPRHFGNHPHIVCHRCGCRSGSWEESMGRVADVYPSAPHDDSGSYDGGDSEIKMTRLATAALRWPRHRDGTRSGTSSKEVASQLVIAQRPLVGSNLEPARLETAGGVPRD